MENIEQLDHQKLKTEKLDDFKLKLMGILASNQLSKLKDVCRRLKIQVEARESKNSILK